MAAISEASSQDSGPGCQSERKCHARKRSHSGQQRAECMAAEEGLAHYQELRLGLPNALTIVWADKSLGSEHEVKAQRGGRGQVQPLAVRLGSALSRLKGLLPLRKIPQHITHARRDPQEKTHFAGAHREDSGWLGLGSLGLGFGGNGIVGGAVVAGPTVTVG